MSGAISATTMATMAATAAVAVTAAKASAKKGLVAQALDKAKPPPMAQAASMPDQQATRMNATSQSGGYGPGGGGTLLTGGVDPDSLLLGKNKLLGQ